MSGVSKLVPAAVGSPSQGRAATLKIIFGRAQQSSFLKALTIWEYLWTLPGAKFVYLNFVSVLPNRGFATFAHFPDYVPITYPPASSTYRFNNLRLSPHHPNSPLWLKSPKRLFMAPSHPQKPAMRMPVASLLRMKRMSQCFTMPKTSTSSIRSCIHGPYGSPSHQVERFVHLSDLWDNLLTCDLGRQLERPPERSCYF